MVRKALEFFEPAEEERRKAYRSGALTGHRMGPFVPIVEMNSMITIPSPYTEIYEKGRDVLYNFRKKNMGWNQTEYMEWVNKEDESSTSGEDPNDSARHGFHTSKRNVERIEEETWTTWDQGSNWGTEQSKETEPHPEGWLGHDEQPSSSTTPAPSEKTRRTVMPEFRCGK